MALATVKNTFGGQFQNFYAVILLLSLKTTLTKATRFDSNNLIDFGKMGYHWKKFLWTKIIFNIFNIFLTIIFKIQKKSDKVMNP